MTITDQTGGVIPAEILGKKLSLTGLVYCIIPEKKESSTRVRYTLHFLPTISVEASLQKEVIIFLF